MTTLSIHHSRPATRIIAGAALVAAVAAGSAAVGLVDHSHATAPALSSHTSVDRTAGHGFPYQPTTSGGRVMLGQ
jgi:hypothetical protein